MGLKFFIVDDDAATRRMLQLILEESDLGEVVGTAAGGQEAMSPILSLNPDVVLLDLLMPDQDGIETVERLKEKGYHGPFVMISQVINKDMVGEAYRQGVEFFIHKPINRIEVESILNRVNEHLQMKRSLMAIRQSLSGITEPSPRSTRQMITAKDMVLTILHDMGIAGESGSADLVRITEILVEHGETGNFPPLKDLYEQAVRKGKSGGVDLSVDLSRETKAMEQRIRRAISAALTNLASLGLTDYTNPKFEHYATRFFDFQDVRARMRQIDDEVEQGKGKVNLKKFIQVLYFETMERMKK